MKERPILFNAEMVKAILAGTKTQTRRVIKPQPKYIIESVSSGWKDYPASFGKKYIVDRGYYSNGKLLNTFIKCPYGQVGDRLWVRETWFPAFKPSERNNGILYYADGKDFNSPATRKHGWGKGDCKWKPSIFMPRWASRITLEITEVRVERVQEITPLDCLKEGINIDTDMFPTINAEDKYRGRFQSLWNSLNAKRGYGWEVNPWVWVISFKEVQGES